MTRRGGKRRTRPEALGELVPALLDDLGLDATRLLTKIGDAWPQIVGTAAARQSRPSALRGRTLEIETGSSVWVQTLRLQAPAILAKLEAALGAEAPQEIWVRIGGRSE